MTRRPIFMIPTEGKRAEKTEAEAWAAIQKYLDARRAGENDEDDDEA